MEPKTAIASLAALAQETRLAIHRLLVEVQAAVLERAGVLLTPEIRLIGRFEQPDLVQAGGAGEAP